MSVQDALEGLKMLQASFEKRNDRESEANLETVKQTMSNLRATMKQQGETERTALHEGEANKRNAASVGATYAGLNFKKKVYNEQITQPGQQVEAAVKGLGLPENDPEGNSIIAAGKSGNATAAMKEIAKFDPNKVEEAYYNAWMAEKDPAKKTLLLNQLSQYRDYANMFNADQANKEKIRKFYGPLTAKAATITVHPGMFPEIIKNALKNQDGNGPKLWQNLDTAMHDNAGDIKDQVINNNNQISNILAKTHKGDGNAYIEEMSSIQNNMADQLMLLKSKSGVPIFDSHAMASAAAGSMLYAWKGQGSAAFSGKDYSLKISPQTLLNMSDKDLLQFQPPTTTSPSPAAPAAPAATSTPAEAPSFGKSFSNNIINEPISAPQAEPALTEPNSSQEDEEPTQ